jgi:hypothetical protein
MQLFSRFLSLRRRGHTTKSKSRQSSGSSFEYGQPSVDRLSGDFDPYQYRSQAADHSDFDLTRSAGIPIRVTTPRSFPLPSESNPQLNKQRYLMRFQITQLIMFRAETKMNWLPPVWSKSIEKSSFSVLNFPMLILHARHVKFLNSTILGLNADTSVVSNQSTASRAPTRTRAKI